MEWKSKDEAPKDGRWILIRGRNAIGKPMVPISAAWKTGSAVGTNRTDNHLAWRSAETGNDLVHLELDGWDWAEIDWQR